MSMYGRVLRRAVFRVVRGAIQRRRLVLAAFVIAAGAIVVTTFNLVSLPGAPTRSRAPSDSAAAYQGSGGESEPTATASYIRGQQVGDARMVWDAYSDRVKRTLQSRGGGLEATQRQLEESRQNGGEIRQVRYVGTTPIPNGRSMHFYVLERVGQTRGDVAYIPYVFTLDPQGKIDRIE